MRKCAVIVLSFALVALGAVTSTSGAVTQPAGTIVSDNPADYTPHVLDGRVQSIVQVGDTVVLGGTFTQARESTSQTVIARNGLLAFSASTGRISTTFAPNPNGAVNVVLPTGDGQTVFVGGTYTSIGGQARTNISKVRVSDGAVIGGFNAGSVTGQVKDLRLVGGRLWMGGGFTHIAGRQQLALATLNPTTGAFDPFMSRVLGGVHNSGFTTVLKMESIPQRDQLVAIGNFDTVDGQKRHQLLVLDVGGTAATLATFRTSYYETPCSQSFDSYMRDVDVSADGTYFAVVTTGAYGGAGRACDSTARFQTADTGDVQPAWVNNTGGDTLWSVELVGRVAYVGGHPRWQNNPFAGDRPGQGAVSRPGMAALDVSNGLPYSWNPTRTRGIGLFDFLSTSRGLWVTSDTDRIGAYEYHGRVALMPEPGKNLAAIRTPGLPNDVYTAQTDGALTRRSGDGTTFSSPATVGGTGINWNNVRGAFMVNGQLYIAGSDGSFTRRSFNGTTIGAPTAVDTADELVPMTTWRNEAANATSMFFDNGRLYYTLAGSSALYYRYFTPESDIVGAERLTATSGVAGLNLALARGAFTTGQHLYVATTTGQLTRTDWSGGPQTSTPVAGTTTTVATSGWGGRALFLFQDPNGQGTGGQQNQAPTASFTQACSGLTCAFDASGSTDADGNVASFSWAFGDGGTATGASPSHTYASAGTRTVTLTVTDNRGATGTTTRQVAVSEPPAAGTVSHVGSASTNGNRSSHTVTVPTSVAAGDRLLLFFTVNSSTPTVTPPAGWTAVQQTNADGAVGNAWTKVATASDAGSPATVGTSAVAKSDLTVAAYRASAGTPPVTASAVRSYTAAATSFTSPTVTASGTSSWLVTYFGAKGSSDLSWTPPSGQSVRAQSTGTQSGRVSALAVDSGAAVPAGTRGGLTATASSTTSRAVVFSILVG